MPRATRNRTSAAAAAAEEEAREEAEEQQQQQQEQEAVQVEGEEADDDHDDNDDENEGDNEQLVSLQFNEPLSWKAGKAIPVTTLIRRLTTLFEELDSIDQEAEGQTELNKDSFATAAKELAAPNLVGHRDDGVKAYTACCLAEILRIYAPNAPYTGTQLKDIFNLFVICFKGMGDKEAPYYEQYLHVLESLAKVETAVLLPSVPECEPIMLEMFKVFFDNAKSDTPKNIEYLFVDVMVQIIEECEPIPADLVDIIISQFLRATPIPALPKKGGRHHVEKVDDRQMKLTNATKPVPYHMAQALCKRCPDKMARCICQYFSDVILSTLPSGRRKDDEDEEDGNVPDVTKEDIEDLRRSHILAKELWSACPQTLQNVIPLLEQELLSENAELREMVCKTLGEMALIGNFSSAAPATWKAWLGRVNDKSPIIRALWVELAIEILKERDDLMAVQLVDLVAMKLNDMDERVRLAACRSLKTLKYLHITSKLAADTSPFNTYDSSRSPLAIPGKKYKEDDSTKNWGKKILQNLSERVRDKKIQVRLEGMVCLAKMWEMAYKDLAIGNDVIEQQLGWIPSKILDTFYINDPEVNVLLDHVLHEILLPVNYPPIEQERQVTEKPNGKGKGKAKDDAKERDKEALEGDKIRVQRLLVLVKGLDTKAKRALYAVPLRQISYAKVMDVFIKSCEDFNGGVIENNEETIRATLDKFSAWLSQKLPEPPRAKENLLKFARLHDRRCYQLIRFCFNPDSDYRTVVRALKEIKKRVSTNEKGAGVLDSLTPLLYRVSQLIYNKSHVAPIVEFSRTDELGLGATAHEVLKEMSASNPGVFKANVKALADLLQETAATGNTVGSVDTLKACASFAKSYPKDIPQEKKLLQALVQFALTGNPPASAKHATTILMKSASRKEMYAADLLKRCLSNFKFGGEHYLAKLGCLGQLLRLARDQCEDDVPRIMEIAMEVLAQSRTDPSKDEAADEWADDSEIEDECTAKILALRILVNLLRQPEVSSLEATSRTVMKLLLKTVVSEGEITEAKNTPVTHKSRLRLAAAQFLLKLATFRVYDEAITPKDFHRIATVAQDRCYQVRRGFIDKLKKYLGGNKLPPRYYTIIFLMAFEPVTEWRDETTNWIKGRAAFLSQKQGNVMENIFPRLMSLLVHHPDFGTQVEDLSDFARYILFYLNGVANEDNISLIYYIAQRVKQFRDVLSKENSDNLYYLSDLSQVIIRLFSTHHKWTLQTWPGKLQLPASLFEHTPDAVTISKKSYLPDGIEASISSLINAKPHHTSGRKRKSEARRGDGDESTTDAATPHKPKKARTSISGKSKTPKERKPKKAKKVKEPKTPVAVKDTGERRRSGRMSVKKVAYREESEEEESEMEYDEEESELSEPEEVEERDEEELLHKEPEQKEPVKDADGDIEMEDAPAPATSSPAPAAKQTPQKRRQSRTSRTAAKRKSPTPEEPQQQEGTHEPEHNNEEQQEEEGDEPAAATIVVSSAEPKESRSKRMRVGTSSAAATPTNSARSTRATRSRGGAADAAEEKEEEEKEEKTRGAGKKAAARGAVKGRKTRRRAAEEEEETEELSDV
ncbi:hypothetical protein EX30DRAFT_398161 [Ascodesmis nigricans]|uniref:ARM repeat-containing protein n=1 Tax=Ascodesmis nigricans TaxID=341454 RepID=A0A4S2MLK6_9PEZI|nr:hypothetical protein EX30DRAFT_398161 [Ascodesmis nigricans]